MSRMESILHPIFCLFLYFKLVATFDASSGGVSSQYPQFVGNLKNITEAIGREAVFSCNVRDLPPFRVGWVRSDSKAILSLADTVITHDPRISVSGDFMTTFNLHITNVQEEDRGQYMCQINTDPMMAQTGILDVNVPPDIDSRRTSGDVEAKIGSTVSLECNADGYPRPVIKWRREKGEKIKILGKNGRMKKVDRFIGSKLTIHDVETADMGSYLCMADNGVPPIVSKRIFLYVQFAPEVFTKGVIGAAEGGVVILKCDAKAYPTAMVEWMHDGNIVTSNGAWKVNETVRSIFETTKILLIRKAESRVMGQYICRASNSIGMAEARVQVYLMKARAASETSNIILIAVIEGPKNTKTTTIDLPESTLSTMQDSDNLIKQDIHFQDDNYHRKKQRSQGQSGNIQGTVYDTVVDTKRNSNFRSSATSQKNMSYLMLFYFMLICLLL